MDRDRVLLRHFLGAIAYRAQKALRGAPAHFPDFAAGHQVRTPLEISTEQLLQGPFADVMTHVGQLGLLRRLADAPVPPENFIYAEIGGGRLGADQPMPARPDEHWSERPAGTPPSAPEQDPGF